MSDESGRYVGRQTRWDSEGYPDRLERCVRCGRSRPRRSLAKLIEQEGGGLACTPRGRTVEYEECLRLQGK